MDNNYKPVYSSRQDKIDYIKKCLIENADRTNWQEFINQQSLGGCQSIVADIVRMNIQGVEKQFGEISINNPLDKQDFDKILTHHWVLIDKEIFDFSKGTLSDFVDADFDSVQEDGCIEYLNVITAV